MSKITITRALSELGTINNRISAAINGGVFVGVVKGNKEKPTNASYRDAEDMQNVMKASFQSVEDLISRQARLKSAVIASNAIVKVTIGGTEMTVAEAIDRKAIAQYKNQFLSTLRVQLQRANVEFNAAQTKLEEQIERALVSLYQSGKEKVSQEQYDAVAIPLKNDYQPKIVSSKQDLNAYIRQFEAELNNFISECDYILSESNCQTFVDVE